MPGKQAPKAFPLWAAMSGKKPMACFREAGQEAPKKPSPLGKVSAKRTDEVGTGGGPRSGPDEVDPIGTPTRMKLSL